MILIPNYDEVNVFLVAALAVALFKMFGVTP